MWARGRLFGAAGVALLVVICALLVIRFGSTSNSSPGDAHVVYRLVDVPAGTSLDQARNTVVEVITRRLTSRGFSAEVSAGLGADPIDVRLAHADTAQIDGIIRRDGRRFTLWRWEPGAPDATLLGQLDSADAGRHRGYRPAFTGLDGTMIRSATARASDTGDGRPDVALTLNSRGTQLLDEVTKDRIAQPVNSPDNKIAVFIDGKLFEDANVMTEISSGALLLIPDSGSFGSLADAQRLAVDLNAGTIPGRLIRVTTSATTALTP
jgi:preprotein translocase subunit SecD